MFDWQGILVRATNVGRCLNAACDDEGYSQDVKGTRNVIWKAQPLSQAKVERAGKDLNFYQLSRCRNEFINNDG